jgi:FkbM family methyltransferase
VVAIAIEIFTSRVYCKTLFERHKILCAKRAYGHNGQYIHRPARIYRHGLCTALVTARRCFFDIGANVGSYTLLASGVCSAQSVALEPAPSTFDILSQNIRLNKLTNNVTLLNAAAGAVAETLKFSLGEDTTNHILAANETGKMSAEVPIITVDSLFSQNKPILLKIDVEGFETEVIKGMQATLKDSTLQAIIIELNGSGGRYGFNELDIHQTLLSNGFAPYHYNAFERELTKVDKWGSYNTIYIRNEQFISTRLKTAKPFNAMGEAI